MCSEVKKMASLAPKLLLSSVSRFKRNTNGHMMIEDFSTFNYEKICLHCRICKSEKTCHLVDKVPESFRTLRERNCMCDWDCTTYEDCCEDSVYFNKYEERHSLPFHCSTTERVS